MRHGHSLLSKNGVDRHQRMGKGHKNSFWSAFEMEIIILPAHTCWDRTLAACTPLTPRVIIWHPGCDEWIGRSLKKSSGRDSGYGPQDAAFCPRQKFGRISAEKWFKKKEQESIRKKSLVSRSKIEELVGHS